MIDWIIDLARRSNRRIMVRLVKGAYWDAEIKRTQVDGLADFPVYTRKIHTDVAYIACARTLLAAKEVVFPQFATHNAQTLATIFHLAGSEFTVGDYEFQCLHGMGEPLYDEVVGADKLDRPCRIYAPVGTHETLLAYLVRRLLENGANSSFVNRIADPEVSIAAIVADPVESVRAMIVPGQKNPHISLPSDLYGARRNSDGLDLSDEGVLTTLGEAMRAAGPWSAGTSGTSRPVVNPADHHDQVGTVIEMSVEQAHAASRIAQAATPSWAAVSPTGRAAVLERAADAMQARMPELLGLIVREAGKSVPNAIGEAREAIDFLRYYAEQARRTLGPAHRPLGVVTCISPWNFPLAIFTGQVAAALVAGNAVLAKPAEETPLIAAQAVAILHEAGVPADVLQLVPGDGRIGAALVAVPETAAVMFTGSTKVARFIQGELTKRLSRDGGPIPLIAETGGQNAMIVDSSALAEQVVADVIASAFDSAGQRCSALRILCLQEEVADKILMMLRGALHELRLGSTDRLAVDIGPVITAEAQASIEHHIASMRANGHRVEQRVLSSETASGTFVPPTIIELSDIGELQGEVFGPVLHVVRFRRDQLDGLIDDINATGYGLTFGLHTRLIGTIAHVTSRVRAGNLYVNRNVIGAVVGVQPFGGRGLSGTGPKAGGPLYLGRLTTGTPVLPAITSNHVDPAARELALWLEGKGEAAAAARVRTHIATSLLGAEAELVGPVGERNLYALHPRGRVLLLARSRDGLLDQLGVALATGNELVVADVAGLRVMLADLPDSVAHRISWMFDWTSGGDYAGALIEGDEAQVAVALTALADLVGPIVVPQASANGYRADWLVEEVSTSINTTAAGGNASLMVLPIS